MKISNFQLRWNEKLGDKENPYLVRWATVALALATVSMTMNNQGLAVAALFCMGGVIAIICGSKNGPIVEFRIKHIEGVGYFPQVKHRFIGWKKIGKHTNGYGLYPESDTDYPLVTEFQAINRCREYRMWHDTTRQVRYSKVTTSKSGVTLIEILCVLFIIFVFALVIGAVLWCNS